MILGTIAAGLIGKVKRLIADLAAHVDGTNVHGASVSATANTIALRSATGILRGEDPVSVTDLVNIRYFSTYMASAGFGTVSAVTAGTGLSGGTITSAGTIALTNVLSSAPGSYTYPQMNVDAQGRITSISSLTPVTSLTATLPLVRTAPTGAVTISINAATTSLPGSMSAADKTKLDNATDLAGANLLMMRDANSQCKVTATPTDPNHVTSKSYVDASVAGVVRASAGSIEHTGTWYATGNLSTAPQQVTGFTAGASSGSPYHPNLTGAAAGNLECMYGGMYKIEFEAAEVSGLNIHALIRLLIFVDGVEVARANTVQELSNYPRGSVRVSKLMVLGYGSMVTARVMASSTTLTDSAAIMGSVYVHLPKLSIIRIGPVS